MLTTKNGDRESSGVFEDLATADNKLLRKVENAKGNHKKNP